MYKEFKRIRFNDDFTIDVMFWSGEFKKFDMKKYIENIPKVGITKSLLDNLELFKHPEEIDPWTIYWNKQIDLYWDWVYHYGVEFDFFEDGIEVPLPQIENKMKMNRAKFNDDFTIDVIFEDGRAKRYDISDKLNSEIWDLKEKRLEVFKNPDNFTKRFISWSNDYRCYSSVIFEKGIQISAFKGGIEAEY